MLRTFTAAAMLAALSCVSPSPALASPHIAAISGSGEACVPAPGGEPLATQSAPTKQIRNYALAQISTGEYLAALELHVP